MIQPAEMGGWQPPPAIGDYRFAPFEDWSEPIEDVLIAGEMTFGNDFSRSIADLKAYRGRLWIGYGDANVNLGGVIPITFRAFTSANDPVPVIGLVSGEEQLDRFRVLNGQLWMLELTLWAAMKSITSQRSVGICTRMPTVNG